MNREGIKAPSGGDWGSSTINGNRQRGIGILNNELYVGRLVWNRLRYIKDPATGKRLSRLDPEADWIGQEVPDLRIVDQDLWDRVKTRQKAITPDSAEVAGEGCAIGKRIAALEGRQDDLDRALAAAEEPPPVPDPQMQEPFLRAFDTTYGSWQNRCSSQTVPPAGLSGPDRPTSGITKTLTSVSQRIDQQGEGRR